MEPEVLLFDEPTSAAGSGRSSAEVLKVDGEPGPTKAAPMIVVTTRWPFAREGRRPASTSLDEGQFVEIGPPEQGHLQPPR